MAAFDRQTLPNGLRVLTATMPQAQSVSCFVMLAAGSRYETRESSGIAHFAEHMFFKGTERRPTARDIAGEVDAMGLAVRTGVPVETGPLAGLDPDETADPRPLAQAIRAAIATAGLSAKLGPKVSVVIDGGGRFVLDEVLADVRLVAMK